MAILSRTRHALRAKTASLALLALAASGCVLFEAFEGGEKRFAFSHRIHVEDEGLDCTSCHVGAESTDEPGMPKPAQCALCHEDLDAEKAPERKAESLFADKAFQAAHAGELGAELLFSHQRHVEAEIECATCHAGIETNEDVLDLGGWRMSACTSCHAERGTPNECATCHSEIREDARPPSHDQLWMRRHGQVVCNRGDATSDDCSMCHSEASCVSCHLEVPPANHTNHWRLRGHGITAALDRQSCATCHTEESCASCHAETRPMSHTAGWGAPRDRHCLSCHFPLRNEGCVVCHQGTPSHALATPKPPDHNAAMNCRMCHGVGQPLPHVDNGDNCNLCHL